MAKTEDLEGIQGEGVSPKKIKRLDTAIASWRGFVTDRMDALEKEIEARDKVLNIMHAENLTLYPYWISDDEKRNVVLDRTEKLKLMKAKDGEPELEDAD
jgi:hypothetical protein